MLQASVIIPAYESATAIGGCLDALRAQTLREHEVIVVNSSPEGDTERVVRARHPEAVFVQSASRLLPHAARNRGVNVARADRFVFTDPDCRGRPDWLERLLAALTAPRMIIGGSISQGDADWSSRGIHRCKFPYSAATAPAGPREVLPTANICIPRAVFEEIGPFADHMWCGDSLICERAHARGIPVMFDPSAKVWHAGTPSFVAFVRQRYARGEEYARSRAGSWSAPRMSWMALAAPLRLTLQLGKTATSARQAGLLGEWIAGLPIELAGQVAWVAGETRAFAARAVDSCTR